MRGHETHGKRVQVYIGERDKAEGRHDPLWETLLHLLRDEGAAGATMFRGLAGFGAHSKIHTARLADLVPDLPVVVEWVDNAEQVARLLPRISQLVAHGTITVETLAWGPGTGGTVRANRVKPAEREVATLWSRTRPQLHAVPTRPRPTAAY